MLCVTYFGTLLAGRLVQALGVGVTMPLLQTLMLSIFPANNVARHGTCRLSYRGCSGNWPDTSDGSLILINGEFFRNVIPLHRGYWGFGHAALPTKKSSLDWFQLHYPPSVLDLLYGFSEAVQRLEQDRDYNSIIGVIFILLFGWRQLVIDDPFLELRVLKQTRVFDFCFT